MGLYRYTLTAKLSRAASTGAGVVHCCQEMRQLGPLGRSDVLAHVDDAVHGYVRVGLHQTRAQEENYETKEKDVTRSKSIALIIHIF